MIQDEFVSRWSLLELFQIHIEGVFHVNRVSPL